MATIEQNEKRPPDYDQVAATLTERAISLAKQGTCRDPQTAAQQREFVRAWEKGRAAK